MSDTLRRVIRTLIAENSRAIRALTRLHTGDSKPAAEMFNLGPDDVQQLALDIPSLAHAKGVVGKGSRGIAFSLDNGNILKVFYGSDVAAFRSYEKMQNDQGTGHATALTPMIYDLGSTTVGTRSGHGGAPSSRERKINYVEMGRVMPLENWVTQLPNGAKLVNDDGGVIDVALREIWGAILGEFDDDTCIDRVIDKLDKRFGQGWRAHIKEIFILDLMRAVISYNRTHGDMIDLHVGNIGVMPGSTIDKPRFVFFDA